MAFRTKLEFELKRGERPKTAKALGPTVPLLGCADAAVRDLCGLWEFAPQRSAQFSD
jgi:hypothetical protein